MYKQIYQHIYKQIYQHIYKQIYQHIYKQIYQHIYISRYTSIYISRYTSIYISRYTSIYISRYTSIYISRYTSIYISRYTSIYISRYTSIYISRYTSIYISRYTSIYISRYTSICISLKITKNDKTINSFDPLFLPGILPGTIIFLFHFQMPYKIFIRFCYFCRNWIKINVIFGLICKKNVVGAIPAGTPIRLLWKFYFIVSRYFLEKHVHNRGSGFGRKNTDLLYFHGIITT